MVQPYISLAEAAEKTPGKPTAATVWRWARKGLSARNGANVKLQHVRVGGRVYTTEQWLNEFFAAVAAEDIQPSQVQHVNRASMQPALTRAHKDADAELEEAGM